MKDTVQAKADRLAEVGYEAVSYTHLDVYKRQGYSGYNKVPDAKRTACWAHIRRYLADAIPKGKALDYTCLLYTSQHG